MVDKTKEKSSNKESFVDKNFSEAISERYLAYALSIIASRSLPDVRDGLKPVHRRLLYAMRLLKLDPHGGYKKCARVVGDVIGKYHPHGDQAVYDTLVRLAQDFAIRYPLVDGMGNFGNVDGDNAAAMRYTEARLTLAAEALLEGIDQDSVDFRQTYDGEDMEPLVLPAAFPNLLANGAMGIAVGMATNIPPHNVGEICDALLHLLKYPKATIGKICELIPGPDFPTGGVLVEDPLAVTAAYKMGRGGFRVRAKWEIENLKQGLYQIVIKEIPFQVQKSRLIEKIADLLFAKKLPLIYDVIDESAHEVRIVIEPKNRSVDPVLIMEQLFSQTELETRFNLNMNVIDIDNTPRVMNLREVLHAFLDHRISVLIRRSKYRLKKILDRLLVLDAYIIAYLNLDEVIRIIREEENAHASLVKMLRLKSSQADAILNMRLRRLRMLEEAEIKAEHSSLISERKTLNHLLKNKVLQKKQIASEIKSIKERFGPSSDLGLRRTEIGVPPPLIDIPNHSLIEKESVTVICSKMGWIRAIKGHLEDSSAVKYKDGDGAKFLFHAETTDKIIFLCSNGRFYTIACNKLPGGRGFGEPVKLLLDLGNGDIIVDSFLFKPETRLLPVTNIGRGFIVNSRDIVAQTRNGKQIVNLREGEMVVGCCNVDGNHVAIIGKNRKLLIFPTHEVPELARGRGVILQRYNEGEFSDIKTFNLREGLTWNIGSRIRTETNLKGWVGKRGQAGRIAPKGFSKNNLFS